MMKKLFSIALLIVITIIARGQGYIKAEYFFDTDPGIGNGTVLTTSGITDTLLLNTNISTSSLTTGFHSIGFRVLHNTSQWSHTEARSFFISETTPSFNIVSAEYFYDTDPGVGNATSLSVGAAGAVVNFTVPLPAPLATGFHQLQIRVKTQDGIWSLHESRTFYVAAVPAVMPDITAAEYFYDTDPGIGNGIAIPIATPVTLYKDSAFLTVGALPLGSHYIGIRVRNTTGKWSLIEHKPFTVCTVYGPLSKIKFHTELNRVFFDNLSTGADTTTWLFGDNTSDTVLKPIKTYNSAGAYTVKLISKNICGIDTASVNVLVNGLQFISGTKGGDSGIATITFNGIGFTGSTNVKLMKGSTIIMPISQQLISGTRITAYFNLDNAPLGLYNAIATTSGGSFDTLKNAYTIAPYTEAHVIIAGALGPKFSRPGTQFKAFVLQNQGLEDAVMAPFVVRMGYSTGTFSPQMYPQDSMLNLQTEGIFQNAYQYLSTANINTGVMAAFAIDTAKKRQLYATYKIRIPAASNVQSRIQIYGNGGNIYYGMGATVQQPMFTSGIVTGDFQSPVRDCMNSFLRKAVRNNISAAIDSAGWNNCFNTAFDTLAKTIKNISINMQKNSKSIPLQAVFSTLLTQMLQCGSSGLPPVITQAKFKKTITDVTYNWIFWENIDSLGRPCFDTTESFTFDNYDMKQNIGGRTSTTARTAEDDGGCPGLAGSPELLDECEPFLKACGYKDDMEEIEKKIVNQTGKKILSKATKILDYACKLNSGSVFCEKMCEGTSSDPNQKFGPGNNLGRKHINTTNSNSYSIFFENLATAAANAAYVEIKDTIDKIRFDITSFQLGSLGWADSIILMDADRTNYSVLKDLRPAMPNKLRIDFRLDTLNGIATWRFITLDTATLQLTINPLQGFLPPNINGTQGLGYVSFNIAPKPGVVTSGTVLQNKATIIFDNNSPIITPIWEHIIDTTRPQSQVNTLPPSTTSKDFVVNWSGTDAHAGVENYCVYVSVNDSAFVKWKDFVTALSDTFHGQYFKTYKFYSRALDRANNFEKTPDNPYTNPDAVITIQIPLPLNLLSFKASRLLNPNKSKLEWTTDNEVNTSHFEIQRSYNGVSFTSIGNVAAKNSSGINYYLFTDSTPVIGGNFYRLKQIDRDQKFTISNTVVVNFGSTKNLLLYPTVVQTDFVIHGSKEKDNVRVIDATGRIVKQIILTQPNQSINIKHLPNGIYWVKVSGVDEATTFKLIKQ